MEDKKKKTKHVNLSEMLLVQQDGADQSRTWQNAFRLEGEKLAEMHHKKF